MYHAKPEIEVKLVLHLFLVTTFCQRQWGEDKLHGEQLERKTWEKFIIGANQSSCAYYSAKSYNSLFQHMFRIPEKRPPKAVSTAFTALVFLPLAIMLIVVSIAWRYVWAKFVRAFPMSTKLWKIRSALWVWQWPCGLGTGPPRERVLGLRPRWVTVLSCFTIFSYKHVWKAVFVFLHQPGHICC